ncbi:hypothetical protein BH10PSE9_BH10PSE9_23230 [soil metagenome]
MAGQWLTAVAGIANVRQAASLLVRRIVRRAMLMGLVGLLWLIAAGFAFACFTIWLAGLVGTVAACGIVAAILGAAALAIQLGMSADATPAPPEKHQSHSAGRPSASASRPSAGAKAPGEESTVSDETALAGAAVVSLAGYLLGRMVRKT